MLTNIAIEGFKAWRKTGHVRLAPLTAFFGTNSSGKTSLLQFILMLKQTAASADRSQVLELGGERSYVQLGTYEDILFKKGNFFSVEKEREQQSRELSWSIEWSLDDTFRIPDPKESRKTLFQGKDVMFEATLQKIMNGQKSADGNLRVANMRYRFGDASFGMQMKRVEGRTQYDLVVKGTEQYKPTRTRGRAWDLPAPLKFYGFPDQARGYYQNTAFLSDLELLFEEMLRNIHYLGPLREHPARQYTWAGSEPADMGRRGEAAIAALLASRRRGPEISLGQGVKRRTVEEHVAHWLRDLGLVEFFRVEEIAPGSNLYRVMVREDHSSAEVLLTDVGFGISQILPVLVLAFYAPPGSTVILEQPELHLHPSVQAGLADVLIDAIELRGIQFIVESHSEHLLLRLQRRIAEEKFSSTNAAIYFCSRDHGASVLQELDMDLLGNIKNWPKGFFGDSFAEREAMVKAGLTRRRKAAN